MEILEQLIKEWYESKGYSKSYLTTWFKIELEFTYKNKKLVVRDLVGHKFYVGSDATLVYENTEEKISVLISNACDYFKLEKVK